jgi:hypothetical protein
MTTKKAAPPPDDPVQSHRFVQTAKEVEADGDAFSRALRKIIAPTKRKTKKQ